MPAISTLPRGNSHPRDSKCGGNTNAGLLNGAMDLRDLARFERGRHGELKHERTMIANNPGRRNEEEGSWAGVARHDQVQKGWDGGHEGQATLNGRRGKKRRRKRHRVSLENTECTVHRFWTGHLGAHSPSAGVTVPDTPANLLSLDQCNNNCGSLSNSPAISY